VNVGGSPFAACEIAQKRQHEGGSEGEKGAAGAGVGSGGGVAGEVMVLEGVLQESVPQVQRRTGGECGSFCGVFSERRRPKDKGSQGKGKGSNPGKDAVPGGALALAWSEYDHWDEKRLGGDVELLAMTTPADIADKAATEAEAKAAEAAEAETGESSALEDDGFHPDEGVCTRCTTADCKQSAHFDMESMTHYAFLNYLHGERHYHHGTPPEGEWALTRTILTRTISLKTVCTLLSSGNAIRSLLPPSLPLPPPHLPIVHSPRPNTAVDIVVLLTLSIELLTCRHVE
jgi:hypothetical protein